MTKMNKKLFFALLVFLSFIAVPVSFACEGFSKDECKISNDCKPVYSKILFFNMKYKECQKIEYNFITGMDVGVQEERENVFVNLWNGLFRNDENLQKNNLGKGKGTYYIYSGSKLLASIEERF